MRTKTLTLVLLLAIGTAANAQRYDYVQQGEFGITVGAAHYFGDLNTRAAINRPKPALGIFFKKQFGNYVGLKVSAHYAQVGYSDIYSKNDYQKTRNLSFNSNIWELAVLGDFNFFKFYPGDPDHAFTPYVTLGVGVFTYDPYAFINGDKEFLRPLGTEGQLVGFDGRKPYSNMAFCIPLGVGVKYNLSQKVNVSFEISNRFTNTDYLDDVSTTYAGINTTGFTDALGQRTTAGFLQDRSTEIYSTPPYLGDQAGRQRGWSKQKDQYIFAEIGLSFNISTYRCPTAN
jgi:hypothetical protein